MVDAAENPCSPRPELRADAARNRAKVLEVARRHLREGDTVLAMNTISKEAGVGVGTVYRHFPTRESLIEAVATRGFAAVVDEAHCAAAEADPMVGLRRIMESSLASQLADPALATIIAHKAFPEFEDTDNATLGIELKRVVTHLVERAHEQGRLREDIQIDDLRRLMVGVCSAVRSGDDAECSAQRYVDIVFAGLGADSEACDPV